MGRSTVEQAGTLVPLYRAVYVRDAGDEGRANELFAQALAVSQCASPAQRYFLEATVLGNWKKQKEAIVAFNRHLECGGADAGFIGTLSKFMGSMGGTQGQAELSRQQERTHEQALAFLVANGAYSAAQPHLEALEEKAGKDWWKRSAQPWQELCTCGEMFEGLQDLQAALDHYDEAIAQLEARRSWLSRDELKAALASDKSVQYLYFLAARAALRSGDKARSFCYAESGKARALLDLMATAQTTRLRNEPADQDLQQWQQLNAQLTLRRGSLAQARGRASDAGRIESLTQQIEADEEHLRIVENNLSRSHPKFHEAVSSAAKILSLEDACSLLPTDTALLQFLSLGDDLLAWVLTRHGMMGTLLAPVNAKSLARQVRAFHRACSRGEDVSVGDELAEVLLRPFANVVRSCSHLIVVPYGVGHLLPFHALPFEGQPLASTRAVSYLPSASMVEFIKPDATRPVPQGVLAIGNPTGNLPGAEIEAAYVARLFGQKPMLGNDATESAVRSRITKYSVLHFATHGNLSEDAPLASSILLAKGEELTVYELMGLRLDADLVVLSACETGRGETTGGDDVVGLVRGLLAAGARAAVVSLWPVDDISTALFMGEFYRQLKRGQPPAPALQSAQRYLSRLTKDQREQEMEGLRQLIGRSPGLISDEAITRHLGPTSTSSQPPDYRHPYYWAPFVLVC
jgi:hypothetical protein